MVPAIEPVTEKSKDELLAMSDTVIPSPEAEPD